MVKEPMARRGRVRHPSAKLAADNSTSSRRAVATQVSAGKPKLLDQVRDTIRTRHYSHRTEEAYVGWIRRYILFHNKRHPAAMGKREIEQFLTALAVGRCVAASTQNQALAAILFLYKEVLELDPGWLDQVVRAKRPRRLPVVLTRREVEALLSALDGIAWIMAMLLYGSGLRLMECLRLRVKDIDFGKNEILVREGKGDKDRVTMLASAVTDPLSQHLDRVRRLHARDLQAGLGRVQLPHALARKYPNADREWGWQWVFPAARICTDPRFGPPQRFHLHESVPQRAIRGAARKAGISKLVGPHVVVTLVCPSMRANAEGAVERARACVVSATRARRRAQPTPCHTMQRQRRPVRPHHCPLPHLRWSHARHRDPPAHCHTPRHLMKHPAFSTHQRTPPRPLDDRSRKVRPAGEPSHPPPPYS